MESKQRFEFAIEGYKDVCEQLRRWEDAEAAKGVLKPARRSAIREYLSPIDLFGIHRAYFELAKGVAGAEAIFERELQRFEAALRSELVRLGFPIS